MLSRTADHLYWMARYTERAENTARLLGVNCEMALMPFSLDTSPDAAAASTTETGRDLLTAAVNGGAIFSETRGASGGLDDSWLGLLGLSDLQEAYFARYTEISQAQVIDFMVRDPTNPSSILSCLRAARENARAVRVVLTTEVWEAINATWLRLQAELLAVDLERDPARFLEWVKYRSHLFRGVIIGTMLKDEAMHFIGLGTFLERADNTARILDAKFHSREGAARNVASARITERRKLQSQFQSQAQSQFQSQSNETAAVGKEIEPGSAQEPSPQDFYYWAALLRSVSSFEIYRRVFRDVITPQRVVELLVLRADMPRSLLACMDEVVTNLRLVGNQTSADTERFAGKIHADLRFATIDDILQPGLHIFLSHFMEQIYQLGVRIGRDFLLPDQS